MGTHILLSLYGIEFDLLDDMTGIRDLFDRVTKEMGATVLNRFSFKFQPQGVTVVYALAESHISIHTFPEEGSCAIDIYTCGDMYTKKGARMMIEHFDAIETSMQEISR